MSTGIKGYKKWLVPLLFATFLMYAVYFNAFGTNARTAMAFFNITEAKLGMILTVQSVGSIVVSIYLALFGERYNKLNGVALGLLLMAVASLLMGTLTLYCKPGSGYGLMLAFTLVAGVGIIMIDLLMNGVVADIYPRQKTNLLPFVHAFYGTGAMIAPVFVTSITNPDKAESFTLPYLVVGILSAAVLVGLGTVRKKILPETPYADMKSIRAQAMGNPAEVFHSSKAWLFLAATVFYTIFQTGMSSWLPSFCTQQMKMDSKWAGAMLTVYFAGILIIRFISPLIYKKMSVASFYVLSNLLSVGVFALYFLLQPEKPLMIGLIALGGLLQGTSIPALVILCCDAFPKRTASASALVVIGISAASFIAPAGLGKLIELLGYAAPMLIATGSIAVSVVFVLLATKKNKEQSSI